MMSIPKKLTFSTFVLSALVSLSVGCKPKNEGSVTETKSLDNFAKTKKSDLTVNTCGIEYTGSEKLSEKVESFRSQVKGADEFRNVALGVMEAVPENLMGAFFALQGKIVISSKAESLCQSVTLSPAEKGLAGAGTVVPACWRQSAPGQPPEIVLPENKEIIRHSLLRMFSYVFAEAFVAGIDNAESGSLGTEEAKAAAAGFKTERGKLSTSFLADLRLLKRPAVYRKMLTFRKTDAVKFGNYVYAEAIDSYYCSTDSRTKFKSMFKKTWNRFTSTKIVNSPVTLFGAK